MEREKRVPLLDGSGGIDPDSMRAPCTVGSRRLL
jgi:hypothetical protein